MNITINDSLLKGLISEELYSKITGGISSHHQRLIEKSGAGNDFLGWLELPTAMMNDQLFWENAEKIKTEWQKKGISHIVVIGIGGSYLGAKAVYEALGKKFNRNGLPELIFAGHHMSASYLEDLTEFLSSASFGVIVISKSGTTLEPALAFRMLRQVLIDLYGHVEADKRIISITDKEKGALRALTDASGWSSFVIEDSIGGRYSVLSPVGIVPLMLAGFDMKQMLSGAGEMQHICISNNHPDKNPALKYAALRAVLGTDKSVEILTSFQPEFQYFIEWWKQLFGESDGKQHKGIYPAGTVYSTDLHSMGQYIQDGQRIIFETFLLVDYKPGSIEFPDSGNNEDGLDYLMGIKVADINSMAEKATMLAHYEGGVPVVGIGIPDLSEHSLGSLIYFFEFACATGGYIIGVNPFDQPGVEAYKKNMFALMGKPGMENETANILEKLQSFQK